MLQKALASLPKTLNETYAQILRRIDEGHGRYALKILQWLVYSARPLYIEEVAEMLAVNIDEDPQFCSNRRFPDPRDVLAICPSLITITAQPVKSPHSKATKEHVRLAHFSVKEYLVSEEIQIGTITYSIREISANVSIAEICLAYLLQFNRTDSLTSRTIEDFPLARYAAEYWTQHARVAARDVGVINLPNMELFLSNRDVQINWIRLFDPDEPWAKPDISKSSERVASTLYYMSLTGLTELVRLLLERGADVNTRERTKHTTALTAASARGHDQIVEQLLEKGADINARGGTYYGTALIAASAWGHGQVVERLLEEGADINAQGGGRYGTALIAASARGHDRIFERLLEKGADINAQGGEIYVTALIAASAGGHDQIVERLFEKGADINALGGGRYGTALITASARGHDRIVERLLEKGADINARGGGYYSAALIAASAEGHDHIVERLKAAI
jgi:ankyrin repeat protein